MGKPFILGPTIPATKYWVMYYLTIRPGNFIFMKISLLEKFLVSVKYYRDLGLSLACLIKVQVLMDTAC